ncbi:CAP Gly-rich domain-containing protein [Kockiozyma suomiensis]|uniref:CAP Gly-rich domain-containing protein n=1 Tax=Kockiozyma suomiensis TaxID=1337062 RepID=UPI003343A091
MADISFLVTSANTSSERRISPQWSLSYLKTRLEYITGIPTSCQILQVFIAHSETAITLSPPPGSTDDDTTVSEFPHALVPFARLHVEDTRPPGMQENYNDVSGVKKYEMTDEEYAKLDDTVMAYKKRNKLGRFSEEAEHRRTQFKQAVIKQGIAVDRRCRVTEPSERRGVVRFVGTVAELPSFAAGLSDGDEDLWIGVEFDEPVGKNDGSIKGVKYFSARKNHGSFLRPEKVEIGDFPELDDLFDDDDDEV